MAASSDGEGQLFTFDDAGQHQWFVKPAGVDLYWDVQSDSVDDDAGLIQWTWNNGTANQEFQLISCGRGYYLIRAYNSRKFMTVKDASMADGAPVVQYDRIAGADHQLFQAVPVETDADGLALPRAPGVEWDLKALILGGIGSIPDVGSMLAGIVGFFWPDDSASAVFELLKQYVDVLVPGLINQEYISELEKRLEGIRGVLKDYQDTSFGTPQKGQFFTDLLADLDDAEPFFFDKRSPEQTLTYFIALGTIKLTALRDQVLCYERIYGVPAPKHDANQHLSLLKTKIEDYVAAAEDAKQRAIKWRTDQITINKQDYAHYTVNDGLTGEARPFYESCYGDPSQAATRYRTQLLDKFTAALDAFLIPSYLWPGFDPENLEKPQPSDVRVDDGPFGDFHADAFDDGPQSVAITKVVIYADDRIWGIEVFYGGISGGLHGGTEGVANVLILEQNESIVGAYGRFSYSPAGLACLDTLYFETDGGRVVGGGNWNYGVTRESTFYDWSSYPPEGTDAVLEKISGNCGSSYVDAITLTWKYQVHRFLKTPG